VLALYGCRRLDLVAAHAATHAAAHGHAPAALLREATLLGEALLSVLVEAALAAPRVTSLGEATLVEATLASHGWALAALSLALGGARRALGGSTSGAGDVDGLGLASGGVLLNLELDLLAIGEGAEAFHVDVVLMDEEVITTLVRGDEAEAALGIEELDVSGGHDVKGFSRFLSEPRSKSKCGFYEGKSLQFLSNFSLREMKNNNQEQTSRQTFFVVDFP